MEVLFESQRLARDLSKRRKLVRSYGSIVAKRITQRLQELRAAESLEDLRRLPGRCEELAGDRAGQLSVRLDRQYRLIFEPAGNPAPTKPDGGLDWSAVTEIVIVEVVDYH